MHFIFNIIITNDRHYRQMPQRNSGDVPFNTSVNWNPLSIRSCLSLLDYGIYDQTCSSKGYNHCYKMARTSGKMSDIGQVFNPGFSQS